MAICRSSNVLYPPFLRELQAGIEKAEKALDLKIKIFETYRSPQRQDILFDQGRKSPGQIVTNTRGGYSWHQYGVAADIALWKNEQWSWEFNPEALSLFIVSPYLKWGGKNDGPHYQWAHLPRISEVLNKPILSLWSDLDKTAPTQV